MNIENNSYNFPLMDTLEIPDKPKRKYTRKKILEDKKPEIDEEYINKKDELKKDLKRANINYSIRDRRFVRKVEDYIKFILNKISPHVDTEVIVNILHSEFHYMNYKIIINTKLKNRDEWSYESASIILEELHKNCSSIGIHHFNGSYIRNEYKTTNEDNYYLFTTKENVIEFLDEIVELCKIANYSNILYTISSESNKYLAEYAKNNGKEILEFTSKRNKHKIKYYSQLI